MVHSEVSAGAVSGPRDSRDSNPLGIPKSPSFHSGLDLASLSAMEGSEGVGVGAPGQPVADEEAFFGPVVVRDTNEPSLLPGAMEGMLPGPVPSSASSRSDSEAGSGYEAHPQAPAASDKLPYLLGRS